MKLAQLLTSVQPLVHGEALPDDLEIRAVYYRAQLVEPGGLFVAVKGFAADGHDFIGQAVSRGAVAVVCERTARIDVPQIQVTDSRKALAALAAEFYGHPSRGMTVIGITGTNGKTTTSYLIESMLQAAGHATGVIGTVNYRYGGSFFDNPVTTPESLDLQRILADMRAAGTTHVVMEVSSHALDLLRIHACDVDVAVFTNLSQDHLDFHNDMDAYWASKRKLFDFFLPACKGKTALRAVINVDDPRGAELARILALPRLTTSQGQAADVHSLAARFDLHGISAQVQTPQGALKVRSALVGRHNLENILNAAGAGAALNLPPAAMQAGIAALDNVPGRLERIVDPAGQRFVYVDYAHTPDALENALKALRNLTQDRIICVFGCGGDRDRSKRPLMGAIAARLSELAVVTSDNPRTEAPDRIIDQILAGVRAVCQSNYAPAGLSGGFHEKGYVVEPDRRKAIGLALRASRPGDTLLIAGKGHEPYQIIGKDKLPFDDRIVARDALASIGREKTAET
ncbi:MAG: UDP-N-acetylmuramoyl-L-alanyl-D-glutamate--2,6-diaminopimelate ligase [Desulfobacteraceae bacterium]|nr:MAG: UDP-N-acetylmuramoyl-L-alanyl-D-glutamate--2,6-diaminopimelate ligase [Desulfobacteraceae bacterium]